MISLIDHIPILPVQDSAQPWGVIILAFVVGTCLGSFAQAAGLRLNRGEDIVRAPSRCRNCERTLSWRDNLPLIGWLKSMGRCVGCGHGFSPMYMLVELAMGMVTAMLVAWLSLPVAVALTVGVLLMMVCAVTDLDEMLLHLPVMGLLGGAGLLLSFLPFWPVAPSTSLMGMAAVVALITVINGVYMLLRGETGFGSGDYWLLGAVGLWLGPVLSVVLFFAASIIGALVGIAMIIRKNGSGQTALPFGIFISLVFICWPILYILVIVTN